MTQPTDRYLPLGLRVVEVVRQRERTPNAVVDARAPGQQGVWFRTGRRPGPGDFAAGLLEVQHEVDRPGDDRPHGLGEAPVTGDQHVVPDAGGDVSTEVAVAIGVFDDAVA